MYLFTKQIITLLCLIIITPIIPSESSYIPSQGSEDQERTELLNAIYNENSIELLKKAGIKEGMVVLDIGCGQGIMSCKIAHLVGITGQVEGIDFSQEQLTLAYNNAQSHQLTNVIFVKASTNDLHYFSTKKYDAIYIRFLLMHLQNPEHVLQEAHRLLKPGGILVIEEPTGLETIKCYPEHKTFTEAMLLGKKQFELGNTDPAIGYKLKYMLAQYFTLPAHTSLFHPILQTEKEKRMLYLVIKTLTPAFVKHGVKTLEEMNQLAQEICALEKNQSVYVSYFQVAQVCVRKES